MGTVFLRQSDIMKFIAVLALAAVAHAEPDCPYEQDPNNPYKTICVNSSPGCSCPSWRDRTYGAIAGALYAGRYDYAGYTRPYGYGGYYYGKRSADAEPEANADPALLYGAYGYGLPYSGVYRSYGAYSYGYRTYGAYPYAYYGKRSADAEPEADPALLYTTSNVVSPLTTAYTHVAAPLTTAYTHVAAPLTTAYTHSVATPVVKTVPQVATYTVPAVSTVHKAPAHGVAA